MASGVREWSTASGCATLAFVAWTRFEVGGTEVTRAFDDLALMAAAVVAALSCLARSAQATGKDRRAWRVLGFSCLSWAGGQLAWAFYQQVLDRALPFPSVADVGYVVSLPLGGAAVLCFASIPKAVSRLRSVVDGFLIAGSFACLTWFSALERAWHGEYQGTLGRTLALAYPLGTAVTAALVVVVLRRCGQDRISLLVVGAAVLTLAVTNTAYSYLLADGRYFTGHPIDVGWLVAFLLVGLAARVPRTSEATGFDDRPKPLWSLLAPYVPVALVTLLAAATLLGGRQPDSLLVSGMVVLMALVLVRHCLSIIEQKQVESALRATARQLAEAQELTHIGSWEWDLATGILLFSDELYRIHGMEPRSTILNERYRELVHPADRATFDATSKAVAEGLVTSDTEYRVVLADGSVRWLHGRSSRASAPRHGRGRVHGTLEDITARKEAENALRFQARLLQAVGQAVVATDPDGRIIYWNGAAEGLYEWSAEEVLGRLAVDILPADEFNDANAITARLAAGESWSGECRLRRRDGSSFPAFVTTTPVFDDTNQLVAIISTSTDVSERRRAEVLLRASEQRFRQLVEASPLAIVELDSKGRVTLCNRAAETTLGRQAVDEDTLELSEHHALGEVFARVLAGQRVTDHEVWASRDDGSAVHLEVAADVLRDVDGGVTGAIVAAVDVSHRKLLEAQLLQAQKLEAVGRLAGGMAHDFNNLLTIVVGQSELLLGDLGDDPVARPGLEAIHAAAERGAALTSHLLTFSRKRVATRTVVDLNDAVLSLRDLLSRTLGADVSVKAKTDPLAGCVTMARSELDQVMLNLAVNARDAMPDGGSLLIATSHLVVEDGPHSSYLVGVPSGEYAVLTVADSGFGMEPETLRHCFEPFFTTKAQGRGTGLGLAAVYGIVTAAHGYVRVESSPGAGSTFTILLPAVPQPLTADGCVPGQDNDLPAHSEAGVRTLLVVEDEEQVRALAVRVLEREGYRVLTAANGTEVLAVVANQLGVVDIIVTDVVMPELGGIEVAREVARTSPDLDIVFMSGYTDRVLPEIRRGEKPWLVEKPFHPSALARTVSEALRAQARRRGSNDGVVRDLPTSPPTQCGERCATLSSTAHGDPPGVLNR